MERTNWIHLPQHQTHKYSKTLLHYGCTFMCTVGGYNLNISAAWLFKSKFKGKVFYSISYKLKLHRNYDFSYPSYTRVWYHYKIKTITQISQYGLLRQSVSYLICIFSWIQVLTVFLSFSYNPHLLSYSMCNSSDKRCKIQPLQKFLHILCLIWTAYRKPQHSLLFEVMEYPCTFFAVQKQSDACTPAAWALSTHTSCQKQANLLTDSTCTQ